MTPAPDVVEGDGGVCPHMLWAMWEEDAAGVDAHIGFWRTSDGRIAIQSMQSNADVRGRAMLQWIATLGMPVHVVEVIPGSMDFWEAMQEEGLIEEWEAATGWPSDLEGLAVPFPEACTKADA
jgi:hypothetical protein